MKALKIILFASMLLFVGCKDKEKEFLVTPSFLYQTIWDGEMTVYDQDGTSSVNRGFVIEFISKSEGKCNLQFINEIERFTYTIKDSVITFKETVALAGDWYIFEKSPEKIVLQQYTPHKLVLTLKKTF